MRCFDNLISFLMSSLAGDTSKCASGCRHGDSRSVIRTSQATTIKLSSSLTQIMWLLLLACHEHKSRECHSRNEEAGVIP